MSAATKLPSRLARSIDADEIVPFYRDGAAVIRQVVVPEWIDLMRVAVERAQYRILHWDVEPGDVVIHHPLTLHYAAGNASARERRRALALRYVGEEAQWDDNPASFLSSPGFASLRPLISLRDGDPLSGEVFPLVWPR